MNTFLGDNTAVGQSVELSRGTDEEKSRQLERLSKFHRTQRARAASELTALKDVVLRGGNSFEQLMSAVRYCSLGQITSALFEVGGKYRRNM